MELKTTLTKNERRAALRKIYHLMTLDAIGDRPLRAGLIFIHYNGFRRVTSVIQCQCGECGGQHRIFYRDAHNIPHICFVGDFTRAKPVLSVIEPSHIKKNH